MKETDEVQTLLNHFSYQNRLVLAVPFIFTCRLPYLKNFVLLVLLLLYIIHINFYVVINFKLLLIWQKHLKHQGKVALL